MPKTPKWKKFHKDELCEFVKRFYRSSYDWRDKAYHSLWDTVERNYRNIYDPIIKAKKEHWQATMFIPSTVSNVEVVSSSLTKIANSSPRPVSVERRELGDELQAELNTSILDYHIQKGSYQVARHDAVKEATIFGSGFMKVFWYQKWAKRRLIKNIKASIKEAKERGVPIGSTVGSRKELKDILVKEGVKYQHVHIRNIFPEPNTTDLSTVLQRERISYGDLKRMADKKVLDKESVDQLWWVRESDKFDEDITTIKYEQQILDEEVPRPDYGKKHTIWEYWGDLPRKWIELDLPEDTDEQREKANELIPGRALIASAGFFLASEENQEPDMRPPYYQMDYIRTGQTYGLGVGQVMMGLQEELNEVRNQRVDNISLIMNKIFVVLEKYLVDKNEVRSSPGAVIRVKGSAIDDVRKAIMELPISDVPISSYKETFEIERQIQEATAANRVTTGTAGLQRDANQTLGGMELLRQAAFDRFTIYAFIIGRMFDVKVAKKTLELNYLNASEEMIQNILGGQPVEVLPGQIVGRWRAWRRIDPHEFDVAYDLVPVDVFSQENKFAKAQTMANAGQLTATLLPSWNPDNFLKKLWSMNGFTAEETKDIIGDIQQQIPTPMSMGQGIPSVARGTKATTGETPPAAVGAANPLQNGGGQLGGN